MPSGRLLALVAVCGILEAASPGIRPRGLATDYPSRESTTEFAIGAVRIPPADVKKIFAADLNRAGYVVIEVGVYPLNGGEADIGPEDFTLQTETGRIAARAVDTDAIAAEIARERVPSETRKSEVYRTGGRRGLLIPADGKKSSGSVLGGAAEDYPPSSTVSKLGAVEQELWSKSLPDGKTNVPVAGYLYFPKPPGRTSNDWELLMDMGSTRVKLILEDAGKH